MERWEALRYDFLVEGVSGTRTIDRLLEQLDTLNPETERDMALIGAVGDYAESIAPDFG